MTKRKSTPNRGKRAMSTDTNPEAVYIPDILHNGKRYSYEFISLDAANQQLINRGAGMITRVNVGDDHGVR